MADTSYDARNRTAFSREEAEAMVGKPASLTFTGRIKGIKDTPGVGCAVEFELDERWGFRPGYTLVMDPDPFEVTGG